ncbi:MAG: tyrosine-type recombinase/integrase [Leptolinea sp.]|jgi:integrase/recombinase XerD|nr:tyrosine-type recombinase/integrase [Leptolinea sp.]
MQIELEKFYSSMAGVKSPATVIFYQRRLKNLVLFVGDIPIRDVTLDQLRAWRRWLSEREVKYPGQKREQPGRLSPWTVHQHVRACRRFFAWCVEEGLLEISPARRLEKPPEPVRIRRGIRSDARDAIINAANCKRDYALFLIFADTACRLAGIAGMMVDDVDLPGRMIIVREKGRGGNQKERMVFITAHTAQALAAWLVERGDRKTRKIWISLTTGYGLTAGGIYQVLKRTAKRAGVNHGWNPHNWRHGSIRGMLANHAPMSAVSQIAGHSSSQVTADIYGTFDDQELLRIHDQSSWIK